MDQGLSSISNLGLSIAVARQSSQESFGAFALVFAAYLLCQGSVRAIFGEILLLKANRWSAETIRSKWTANTSGVLIFSIALGCVIATISVFIPDVIAATLLALAVSCPFLFLADNLRYWAYATKVPARAALIDALWLTFQTAAFSFLLVNDVQGSHLYVLSWGLSSAFPVLVILVVKRWSLRPRPALAMWKETRVPSSHYLGEYITLSAVQHATIFASAGFGGLAAAGGLRAAQTIMGPANVVTGSANVVFLPIMAQVCASNPKRLPAVSTMVSCTWAIFIACTALLVQLIPDNLGAAFLGESWETGQYLTAILAVTLAFNGVSYGATSGLRALGASAKSLKFRLIAAPLTLGAVCLGAIQGGASGALIGLAASTIAQSLGWWILYISTWNKQIR